MVVIRLPNGLVQITLNPDDIKALVGDKPQSLLSLDEGQAHVAVCYCEEPEKFPDIVPPKRRK